jgi:hypothetical protein
MADEWKHTDPPKDRQFLAVAYDANCRDLRPPRSRILSNGIATSRNGVQ